jgi:hypothetical protein
VFHDISRNRSRNLLRARDGLRMSPDVSPASPFVLPLCR